MDCFQILYTDSPWALVVQHHFLSRSENQYGRQVAILNFEHQSLLPLFLSDYWMDCFQILYTDSPWALVVQHHFLSRSENQYGRQVAILNFEHQSLLPLFLSDYWMDCFQILYTDSPWALVVQHHFFIQIWTKIWSSGGQLEFWTSKFVTAISQQLLDGYFPNFVYRFPLGLSCATLFFIQIWKKYGRQAAILNFEHQSLLPLYLSNYWMDCFQILYTDSPWT